MDQKKKFNFIEFVNRYPVLTAAVLFLLYFVAYSLVERITPVSVILIDTPIDHMIPFSKYAVLPYCLWHVEMGVILLYLAFIKDLSNYWKVTLELVCGLFIILIICMIWPNEVCLRPAVVEGNDIFAVLTRFIYSADNSMNVFPSGHAFGAVVMMSAWGRRCKKPWQYVINITLNMAIILSTLFLKQHSVVDLIAGIVLALILVWAGDLLEASTKRKTKPNVAVAKSNNIKH